MNEENDPSLPDSPFWPTGDEWEEKHERPRGLLTDTDRQFMWGVKEYPHESTASNRRADIRERMENGLRDLFYLTMLSDRDRERILDDLKEHGEPGELRSAIASLIQFLYIGLDADEDVLAETLAHGIGNAENELLPDDKTYYSGASVEAGVDVEIDIKRGFDVDDIEERLRAGRGTTLTPAEVGVLVREGRVDEEDIWNLSHGKGGTPRHESDDPNDEGMPINPTMPDAKWFAEDESVDDLDLAGLWSEDDEE